MARSKSKRAGESTGTWDEAVIRRLIPLRAELAGFLLLVLSALTLLGLTGLLQAEWLAPWTALCRRLLGWGAYPLVLSLTVAALHVILRRVALPYRLRATQVLGAELILLAALPLSYLVLGAGLAGAYRGEGGGLVAWALAEPLLDFLDHY